LLAQPAHDTRSVSRRIRCRSSAESAIATSFVFRSREMNPRSLSSRGVPYRPPRTPSTYRKYYTL